MKKYLLTIVVLIIGVVIIYKIIENNKYNERREKNYICYSQTHDSREIRNDNYYEEKYKFLNNNNIKLFYTPDDKNLEVRNGQEIWVALKVILEMNITEKENKKLSKKEIIGNTFGLKGYEKNNVIYIPEKLQERILANKENYDLSSRKNYDRLNLCRIIEILEDSIEYNNSKKGTQNDKI